MLALCQSECLTITHIIRTEYQIWSYGRKYIVGILALAADRLPTIASAADYIHKVDLGYRQRMAQCYHTNPQLLFLFNKWVTSMPEVTVLITGLGSTTAVSVIKGFRQQHTFRVRIIGTDSHPHNLIAGSAFCDRFYT